MRWFTRNVHLVTGIGLEECLDRLQKAIDPIRPSVFAWSGYAGSKPVLGSVDRDRLILFKRTNYRNSFASSFSGSLVPENRGTSLRGRFSAHPAVLVFMGCWFLGVIGIGSVIFFASLRWLLTGVPTGVGSPWAGIIAPIGMLLAGVAILLGGRWLARREEIAVIECLKKNLEATESEPSVRD